ncbi:MAG: fused MFS/spermidine synthase [Coriobacteriaceae bacterium]|nr:fused MFS/spermidine synthase [Coriobacteriaceae bacterium]MCI6843529.1 fused MFS/spermidine synthase [Coriobacteriaceae bacterium]
MADDANGYFPSPAELLPHVVRTQSGLALVRTTHARGIWQRILSTGGVWQSATLLGPRRMEPPFAYHRAFGRIFDLLPNARRLLAIGGGGFAFPKLVAERHPAVVTDVVEIDPAVIKLARRWFYLDEACELQRRGGGQLNVICADGRRALDGAERSSYDAIVLDAFVRDRPVRSLATLEAFQAAHRALAPHGVLLANVVPDENDPGNGFLRSVGAGLAAVFAHMSITLVTDRQNVGENYIVFSSDAALDLPDAIPFDDGFLGDALRDEARG